jgi:hypothetical protein
MYKGRTGGVGTLVDIVKDFTQTDSERAAAQSDYGLAGRDAALSAAAFTSG